MKVSDQVSQSSSRRSVLQKSVDKSSRQYRGNLVALRNQAAGGPIKAKDVAAELGVDKTQLSRLENGGTLPNGQGERAYRAAVKRIEERRASEAAA